MPAPEDGRLVHVLLHLIVHPPPHPRRQTRGGRVLSGRRRIIWHTFLGRLLPLGRRTFFVDNHAVIRLAR